MLRPYAPPSEKSRPVTDRLPMSANNPDGAKQGPFTLSAWASAIGILAQNGRYGSAKLANLVYLVVCGGLHGPRPLGGSSADC